MSSSEETDDGHLMSAINVTPFVDVVLVLLVIFMLTAPLLVSDAIGIQLPKTKSGGSKNLSTLAVAINLQGQVLLNGQVVSEDELTQNVRVQVSETPEIQAVISADVGSTFGRLARVIDLIKSAGLEKFAIQVEREKDQ